MAEPTLLGDTVQPAWQNLTPEQRTCWHFWAAAHPQLDATGKLRTLYGQQAHYSRNAAISVTEDATLLTDPPPNDQLAGHIDIDPVVFLKQVRLPGNITARRGVAAVFLRRPLEGNEAIVITQTYDTKRRNRGRPPRVRHVTVALPTDTGLIPLTQSDGYYATTGGTNRFSKIHGRTAARRTDLPLAKVRVINLDTGKIYRLAVKNPFPRAKAGANRARATAYKPKTGDHYP
jgi:hypothetical protein